MEQNGQDGEIREEDALRALYESLHLGGTLPAFEPERYARAEALYEQEMQRPKSRGLVGIFNREDLARARRNIERLPWAKDMFDAVLQDAAFWAEFSDETLYAMVPTQIPLALTVAQYHGCPIHGGNRSTLEGDLLHPYRWRCSLGGEWWYNGIEISNPGTGEPLRMVDEGPGWVAPEGFPNPGTTYYFSGAYRCYVLYRLFYSPYAPQTGEGHQGRGAALALALAYALTGDPKYAHKAGLLLVRLADVYGRFRGIKEGWEAYDRSKDPIRGYVGEASGREQGFLDSVALTFDLVHDAMVTDRDLAAFFEARGVPDADGDGRVSPEDLLFHIHRDLFAYAYEFLDRTLPLAGGDFLTSSLYALIRVGVCLENGAMVRQALEAPTGLYNVMANSFFRDGKFWYDSIAYGLGNIRGALETAEWVHGFSDATHLPNPVDLYHDPRFRLREMMAFDRRADCDGLRPMIGDTGGGRTPVLRNSYSLTDEIGYLRLPEERETYARRILAGTGGDPEAGRRGNELYLLFHAEPWTGPREATSGTPESAVFHDSGFCILRAGENRDTRRHLVLNYGKGNRGHGHKDKLAINLMVFGYDLSADLGYPPSWVAPKKDGWETHTASHCTVLLDGENQPFATGSLNLFVPGPWVHLADASAERAYPGLARVYRRAVALVPVDASRSYVVDLFRVAGGTVHDYSFHSLAGENAERFDLRLPDGAEMEAQREGTLAGPDVAFGTAPGYGFVRDAAKTALEGPMQATWWADAEGAGIRLHIAGEPGTTLHTGLGEGPGLQGHSPWDRYTILRKPANGEKENRFLAVLEPVSGDPFLDGVEPLKSGDATIGLEVKMGTKRHDIVYGDGQKIACEVEGLPLRFEGEWAFIEREGKEIRRAQVINGRTLRIGDLALALPGEPGGRVESVEVENRAVVVSSTVPLPAGDALAGHTLVVSRPEYLCNTTYSISGIEDLGSGRYRLRLDTDFLLSEGRVKSVDANVFHTDTPMLKLEVVPNLFDGKVVAHARGQAGPRLKTAEKGKLTLAEPAEAAAFEEKPFYVYDIGAGDAWRIPISCLAERAGNEYRVACPLPVEME